MTEKNFIFKKPNFNFKEKENQSNKIEDALKSFDLDYFNSINSFDLVNKSTLLLSQKSTENENTTKDFKSEKLRVSKKLEYIEKYIYNEGYEINPEIHPIINHIENRVQNNPKSIYRKSLICIETLKDYNPENLERIYSLRLISSNIDQQLKSIQSQEIRLTSQREDMARIKELNDRIKSVKYNIETLNDSINNKNKIQSKKYTTNERENFDRFDKYDIHNAQKRLKEEIISLNTKEAIISHKVLHFKIKEKDDSLDQDTKSFHNLYDELI